MMPTTLLITNVFTMPWGSFGKRLILMALPTLYTYDDQGRKEFTVQALSASILALQL